MPIVPNIRLMLWRILLNSFSALIRSIKIIFHQLIGLFFLLLGVSAAVATWHEYQRYTPEVSSSVVRFYTTAAFSVLLLVFAVNSFWRVRGLRKRE
jgi:di/tricarboxylate transporter